MLNNRKHILLAALLLVAATFISGVSGSLNGPLSVIAQGAVCPQIIKTALEKANQVCGGIGRNKACYGNSLAKAEAKTGAVDFKFEGPGDIADLADVASIKLAAYDDKAGTWGIAVMKVQANLPDTAPGQNVTVLMFGDTEITDKASSDEKPMQAFYFRTGIGNPACKQLPANGVLLQTPKGKQKVEMVANGVQLSIGSTVFLEAPPNPDNPNGDPELIVHTLEGSVDVTANGKTVTVPGGSSVCVPLTSDASGPAQTPCDPRSDNKNGNSSLPVTTLNQLVGGACMIYVSGQDGQDIANVRSGPGTLYGVVAQITPASGDLSVSGQYILKTGEKWWQIGSGWVSAPFVTTRGDCSNVPLIARETLPTLVPSATPIPTAIPPTDIPQQNPPPPPPPQPTFAG